MRAARCLVIAGTLATFAAAGCGSSTIDEMLTDCTEYLPGTDLADTDFKVDSSLDGPFHAYAEASGDMAVVVSVARADVTTACRNIAADLGDDSVGEGAAGKGGAHLLTFWCVEAATKIGEVLAAAFGVIGAGGLTIDAEKSTCPVSMITAARCLARCTDDPTGLPTCNIKAMPPTCVGGTEEVECAGSCSGSATSPTFDCTGSCDTTCTGFCEVSGVSAASAGACAGTCNGTCDAHCSPGPGTSSVKCSGTCASADVDPLTCTGGKIQGGCPVSANCETNCNGSASARATCTLPRVTATAKSAVMAGSESRLSVLVASLEKNLPVLILVGKARGAEFASQISAVKLAAGDLDSSDKVDVHTRKCLNLIENSVSQTSSDFDTALKGATFITNAVA